MYVEWSRFYRTFGVSPFGPAGRLAGQLLRPLRQSCSPCDGLGYVGDEFTCRICRICDGAGGHWSATNAELRAAFAELLAAFPDATAGAPLPMPQLPEHLCDSEGAR
jgi:hypothetical protein